ncbi:MAG: cytochrome b/b6 domain-containing protein [Deltaproteobacteria bacterium]|nr:cytochrome b/b6 domain-containing protein [Deltaproteobacteria bacterium]MBW2053018.1 cytochrome b/b6 domain-containing protein [Deltaproteobacteria bacterium]MBW2141428.1 cytochrome b/b6 domain-containing protein [Deltaproteobacteria bacterium]MBW2323356.1 cytochrome b/b6 domain-containing protein [Deltaproteobacteria bacterium]
MNPEGRYRIRRFSLTQRIFHLLLILCFLTQGATGLARLYIETNWGRSLAWIFSGYESCRTIHIIVGILMILGLLVHGCYILYKLNWRRFPFSLLNPDSILPHPRDIKQFFQHIGWFLGLAKAPRFERWNYFEKFDYWAVFWGMFILGGTGLLLAFPLTASRLIPGWGLNVAFWAHRIEALLALCHVFIIHFFIGHLRRQNFPMDRSMFEGSVDLTAARHEKSAWVTRLEETDSLEEFLVLEVSSTRQAFFYFLGYIFLAAGVYLLIGGLLNIFKITW